MPTYQYRCTECGADLEVVQRMTDAALTVCPTCQGRLRKIFSPVGVVFKGSGFYATDNRSKRSDAAAKTDPAAKPAAAPNAETGSSTAAAPAPSAPPAAPTAPAKPAAEAKPAASVAA
ncbi:MAG: zinc ribbon domain-containing protein [Propionibacteriaceae bacterium]|jgi:putative FmdB family regulatory protein|nr:zinc ribbon domain-containing protein [Propionibacteriaceae bacterium]